MVREEGHAFGILGFIFLLLSFTPNLQAQNCQNNQRPIANAGSDRSGAVGLAMTFTGSGTDSDGNITQYLWNFGDGSQTSWQASPTAIHTYASIGTYTAKLWVRDNCGLASHNDPALITISANPCAVNTAPVPNAGPDRQGNPGIAVSLSGAASTDAQNNINGYWWNFGDGQFTSWISTANITHVFANAGSYSVRLWVRDSCGLTSSFDTVIVTIAAQNQAPTVNAGPDQTLTMPLSGNASINLNGSASDDGLPAGSTLSRTWSKISGPGTVSFANPSAAITTASISAAGSYVLRLTASDGSLSVNDSLNVTLNANPCAGNAAPIANAGADRNGQTGQAISFSGSGSSDPGGSISLYSWNFGDGTTANGVSASHSYSTAGNFTVTLTVTDNCGVSASDSAAITMITLNPAPPIGTNLGRLNNLNSQIAFVDLFKQSSGSPFDPWSPSVPTDAMGYPLSIVAPAYVETILASVADGRYPAGQYTLIFTGDGTIQLGRDASGTFNQTSGTGSYPFTVSQPTSQGIRVRITRSSAANPVKDIRVVMPGHASTYQTQPFYPPLLSQLQGFGVIRFMAWSRTNDSQFSSWSQRTTPSHATQARTYGPSYEHAISLCNQAQADPWFTIPHLADDNFIQQLALLIKNNLNTSRNVYIEYSNELWNGQFGQTAWVQNQGLSLGLNTQAARAGRYFNAKRSAEIFHIFETEFGAQSSRVKKVLATQSGNATVTNDILFAFSQSSINGVSVNPWGIEADYLAGAPYFGGQLSTDLIAQGEVNSISIDTILQRVQTTYLPQALTRMQTDKAAIDAFNASGNHHLQLVAYEGGQSLAPSGSESSNTVLAQKLIDVNRHPLMYDIYRQYLQGWEDRGGQLFLHYHLVQTPNEYGSWGALEYLDQPLSQAHKYRALRDIQSESCVGNVSPTANAGPNQSSLAGSSVNFSGSASIDLNGSIVSYVWNFGDGSSSSGISVSHAFASAGNYTVTLTVTDNCGANANDTVTINVSAPPTNQAPVVNAGPDQTISMPASGNASINLNGSASDDGLPAGSTLSRTWSKVSGPGTVNFANPSAAITTASISAAGSYVLRLTASDGALSSNDSLNVTVNAFNPCAGNSAPISNAGTDRSGQVGQSISFSGSASSDPGGSIASYNWNFGDGLTGTGVSVSHSYSSVGNFTVTLTVTDNCGASSNDSALVTITNPPGGGNLPMLAAHRTSGVAPLAVLFDVTAASSSVIQPASVSGMPDFASFHYQWDFGDVASGNWAVNNRSKNRAAGHVAAHLFETPGNYTITLDVTNTSGVATRYQQSITVQNPETVYANSTFYLASNGNDNNPGTLASPFRTWEHAVDVLFSNAGPRRLLVRRGDTFNTPGANEGNFTGPYFIGTYGTGAAPILQCLSGSSILDVGDGNQLAITGLNFLSTYNPIDGTGPRVNGIAMLGNNSDIAIYRNLFSGIDIAVFPAQLGLIQNSIIAENQMGSWHNYGILTGDTNRLAILGNTIRQNPNAGTGDGKCESCVIDLPNHGPIRIRSAVKAVVSSNNLFSNTGWNPDPNTVGGYSHQPCIRVGTDGVADLAIVSDNLMEGGFSIAASIPANTDLTASPQRVIWERNKLTATGGGGTRNFFHVSNAGGTYRNNILLLPNVATNIAGVFQFENHPLSTAANQSFPSRIYNNTFVSLLPGAATTRFLLIENGSLLNFSIKNNITCAPSATSSSAYFLVFQPGSVNMSLLQSDRNLAFPASTSFVALGAGAATSNHNLTNWQNTHQRDLNTRLLNPLLMNPGNQDFRLQPSSPAINWGEAMPYVRDDYSGMMRLSGATDIGAYEATN